MLYYKDCEANCLEKKHFQSLKKIQDLNFISTHLEDIDSYLDTSAINIELKLHF